MKKKIKKIDEFLDDDSRFDFNIDTTILSDDEKKEKSNHFNKLRDDSLKDHPKRTKPNFTIDEYREIMLNLEEIDNFKYTQQEREELDEDCMEMYGEPFFKKEDNN